MLSILLAPCVSQLSPEQTFHKLVAYQNVTVMFTDSQVGWMALLHTCPILLGQLGCSGHVLRKLQKFKRAGPALQARFLSARMLSANVSLVKACQMAKAIISAAGEYGLSLVGGLDT